MATNNLQRRQTSPAALEEQRANQLQRMVDFATRRCGVEDFDILVEYVLGHAESFTPEGRTGPQTIDLDQAESFRVELERGLQQIADGEACEFRSPSMQVRVEPRGAKRILCYRPLGELGRIPLWWRVVEAILSTQAWRLRTCEGYRENIPFIRKGRSLCRPLFVRRGTSDYCDRKHAAAAQRYRHKLRHPKQENKK